MWDCCFILLIQKESNWEREINLGEGPTGALDRTILGHIDSYDKLKPYGICIKGSIDGLSRHIIWIEAYTTNSDPAVVGNHYMDAVDSRKGCSKRIRADRGTENCYIEHMHKFLIYDYQDDYSRQSFLYGSSNHNQRVEYWWCFLRKQCAQFWMNKFQTLKDEGRFSGDFLDRNLFQFCFLRMIQVSAYHWNEISWLQWTQWF